MITKFISSILILSGLFYPILSLAQAEEDVSLRFWDIQSVDTMKYSRDVAREKLRDKSFDLIIEKHVKAIAESGATHIAIGTPYDEEFIPFMKRWVIVARKYDLNVWFRGNFSGWEGWFEYKKITRAEHAQKTSQFIYGHQDLFMDGDIFTACPECENGGPGDPRRNGDVTGHRRFLIDEYKITKTAFEKINKKVISNFNSMNGDVARLIMDKKTTQALDGIIAIDHYVKTKEKLVQDIKNMAETSGGRVMLAEFGAPIPDIHGKLDEKAQAKWIYDALNELSKLDVLVGINYWVSVGGSTSLWTDSVKPKLGATVLSAIYNPPTVYGFLKDELDRPIAGAKVKNEYSETISNSLGRFELPYLEETGRAIYISIDGYNNKMTDVSKGANGAFIVLDISEKSWRFKILLFVKKIANWFEQI